MYPDMKITGYNDFIFLLTLHPSHSFLTELRTFIPLVWIRDTDVLSSEIVILGRVVLSACCMQHDGRAAVLNVL